MGQRIISVIVEVRDRSRPIGVRYVEEMSAKQRSVRADAVFLVSHSGFTNTALTKAKQLGIRALIYDEATSSDWSNWLQCKTLSIHARKYENPVIAFSQFGSNTQMSISSTTMQVFENDKTAKILRTEDGTPYISIPDLINKIINSLSDKFYSDIKIDGASVVFLTLRYLAGSPLAESPATSFYGERLEMN